MAFAKFDLEETSEELKSVEITDESELQNELDELELQSEKTELQFQRFTGTESKSNRKIKPNRNQDSRPKLQSKLPAKAQRLLRLVPNYQIAIEESTKLLSIIAKDYSRLSPKELLFFKRSGIELYHPKQYKEVAGRLVKR